MQKVQRIADGEHYIVLMSFIITQNNFIAHVTTKIRDIGINYIFFSLIWSKIQSVLWDVEVK